MPEVDNFGTKKEPEIRLFFLLIFGWETYLVVYTVWELLEPFCVRIEDHGGHDFHLSFRIHVVRGRCHAEYFCVYCVGRWLELKQSVTRSVVAIFGIDRCVYTFALTPFKRV